MRDSALQYLRSAVRSATADFRPGQWEGIESILGNNRVLVVQRTGWGKSMVYFLATRLLRDQGRGVTILISPLIALMRNQLAAAEGLGLNAATINSSNQEEWDDIERRLRENTIDILLVSPERLSNDEFRQNVLSRLVSNVGLLVVDEAHCISDWGHDFRPDYRRIVRIVEALPPNIPVLATTATANDRVVNDVRTQLGDVDCQRGVLARDSLRLQNISMPSPAARLAWLAETIPTLTGSGVVYTLTQRDSDRVSQWLKSNGVDAEAYHAGVDNRSELEQRLIANDLKVLVATVALGMGFDKPDIGFVIHFQRPSSVVHYYQQVGRAGRGISQAFGILFHGEEDNAIANYFIRNAFPLQKNVQDLLNALNESEFGLSTKELESKLNIPTKKVTDTLKFLSVESPSPVTKIGSKINATAAAKDYQVDMEVVNAITNIRHAEQAQMQAYMSHGHCLMKFLQEALDDPNASDCGHCANCIGRPLLDPGFSQKRAIEAASFLKRNFQPLKLRRQWPSNDPLSTFGFKGRISPELMSSEGRALCLWNDAGWGQQVVHGKYTAKRFDDSLVDACVALIGEWNPEPQLGWVTCIPSLNNPTVVPDFAQRLAHALELPFVDCVTKIRATPAQKEMQNSFQQTKNLDGAFEIGALPQPAGSCLLVDDIVASGWTFTIVAALLRQSGCEAVFPLALALSSPRMD